MRNIILRLFFLLSIFLLIYINIYIGFISMVGLYILYLKTKCKYESNHLYNCENDRLFNYIDDTVKKARAKGIV